MKRTQAELEAIIAERESIPNTQKILDGLTKDYPQFERDTFWVQELEARGYKADNTTPTPFIDKMCECRGIAKDMMVDKIIVNSDTLKIATAEILGNYQKSIGV